jgi:hypothetical protein
MQVVRFRRTMPAAWQRGKPAGINERLRLRV